MKLLPSWIRDFVDLEVDDRQLADDLSMAGISVEGIDEHDGYSIYEVDITTNRVDAMNHYGVARECAAIYNVDLKSIAPKLRSTGDANFRIYIQAPEQCARYSARIVRGVTIKPSPEYISRRLTLLGSRPINNAADATNYALWELGHPTHAFDLDLLEGNKIIVRLANEGEIIKTLDGVERKLTRQDLVIADAAKAVAIAGVMGGFDTMITEKTKNVLIESAWFDPATIRRTARRLGMHTDASHRFERGADYGITPTAANRVAQLILEAAGGQIEGDLIDTVGRKVERPTLNLHRKEIERILGHDITEFDTSRILKRLGFSVTPGRQHAASASRGTTGSGGAHAAIAEEVADFAVHVPTWRLDVDREIDLIEEIARIYGYDKFPNTLPVFTGGAVTLPDESKETDLRSRVLSLGYDEAISLAFISHADATAFATMQAVEIANPLSEEASVMRTSMIPGMLNMLGAQLESRRKRRTPLRIRQGLREARRAYWRIPPPRHRHDRQRYRSQRASARACLRLFRSEGRHRNTARRLPVQLCLLRLPHGRLLPSWPFRARGHRRNYRWPVRSDSPAHRRGTQAAPGRLRRRTRS